MLPIRCEEATMKNRCEETIMKKWVLIASTGFVFCLAGTTSAQVQHSVSRVSKRIAPLTPAQRARVLEIGRLAYAASDAMKLGNYALAETDARRSMALGTDSGLAKEALAASLDAQGKTQEALQAYGEIAASGDGFPRNLLPYARLLLKAGDYRQAALAYNKALPLVVEGDVLEKAGGFSPDVPHPTALAAAVQTALGLETDWRGYHGTYKEVIQQAQTHFQKAVALEPNSSLANYYMGYGLKRLGKQAEAQAAFRKAAALGTGDVKAAAQKELPLNATPR